MKILIVNTVPTEKNGITNVIFNLLKAMDLNGLEVGYVSISNPEDFYVNQLKDLGIRLHVISRSIKNPFGYIKKLSKVAKGYDVIHVHGNSATMVLEMIAAKLAGVKFRIAHSHNTSCSMRTIDKLARPLFYALCNERLACGDEAGKWLFKNRDFHIVNNGVDTSKFRFDAGKRSSIRKELGWENNPIIGHVGNFLPAKNHEFLITLFAKYTASHPEARLLLLGNGYLKDEAIDQAARLGVLDKVKFAGSVENPQDYLSAMDIIVMPSTFEGLPLTLVEEQANGLDCICSTNITPEADMTKRLHFLNLDENLQTWTSKIDDALDNSDSRDKKSENAIAMIKKNGYDIWEISKWLKSFYLEEFKSHSN